MSDSSDIDFSDDDSVFEQRKQQLIAEQNAKQSQSSGPFADPAFAAQFDPKSPTYHGNHDPRLVNANGGNALPAELQKQYGVKSMSIEDMPDVNDNVFQEDPNTFGPIYVAIYNLRDQSVNLKKITARLQGLVQEYFRLNESDAPSNRLENSSNGLINIMSNIKLLLPKWSNQLTILNAFTKDDLAQVGIQSSMGDFDVKKHLKDIEITMTNIDTMIKITDTTEKLSKEQDIYFSMKKIGTELMSRQSEMLAMMKIAKKNYKKKD